MVVGVCFCLKSPLELKVTLKAIEMKNLMQRSGHRLLPLIFTMCLCAHINYPVHRLNCAASSAQFIQDTLGYYGVIKETSAQS